ncbi:MAG: ROK family protein [Opitutaceae bacterium]
MTTAAAPYLIGVDLGGTRIKVLALSEDGTERERLVVGSDGPDWAARVRSLVDDLHARLGPSLGIGIAAPGLAAPGGRCIAHMPGRLPGLEGLDWTTHLASPRPVPVLNDAQAALLGEVWCGAAVGRRNVLLVTLGTGVGGAVMCDGHLLRGHLGRAGHVGHITVDASGPPDIVRTPGSLEDAVGNHTLGARSAGRYHDTAALAADVIRGLPLAVDLWTRLARDLAAGLVSLINVVDPEIILLGGGISQAGDTLLRPLSLAMDPWEWRPAGRRVQLATTHLGDLAGAYGAARQAQLHIASPSS